MNFDDRPAAIGGGACIWNIVPLTAVERSDSGLLE